MLTGGVATFRQNEPNPRPVPFENLSHRTLQIFISHSPQQLTAIFKHPYG